MKDQRDQRSHREAWGVSAPFVGEDGHLLARPWIGVSVVIALVYLGFKSAVVIDTLLSTTATTYLQIRLNLKENIGARNLNNEGEGRGQQ